MTPKPIVNLMLFLCNHQVHSTVVADKGTTTESFDSQDIQVLSDAAMNAAGSFNNWISNNIGFMLLGSVLIYGVYRFGVKRGAA